MAIDADIQKRLNVIRAANLDAAMIKLGVDAERRKGVLRRLTSEDDAE